MKDKLTIMDVNLMVYIMWRFAGNNDKESIEFKFLELSMDEEKVFAVRWCTDPKETYVYEVKWQFNPLEVKTWVKKHTVVRVSHLKSMQSKN